MKNTQTLKYFLKQNYFMRFMFTYIRAILEKANKIKHQ